MVPLVSGRQVLKNSAEWLALSWPIHDLHCGKIFRGFSPVVPGWGASGEGGLILHRRSVIGDSAGLGNLPLFVPAGARTVD
jgi:hypothetical protein